MAEGITDRLGEFELRLERSDCCLKLERDDKDFRLSAPETFGPVGLILTRGELRRLAEAMEKFLREN